MVQRTVVEFIDDLDGTVVTGTGRTVRFGFEGADYEIDLSAENADGLKDMLGPYLRVARKTGGQRRRGGGGGTARNDPEQLKAIRRWARDHGYQLSGRGRIPREIMQAYSTQTS